HHMISEVVMPQMGADMQEGTILRWLKGEGDQVGRGEVIAEIETDKANVEIEAFESGTFRKAIAHEGDTVPVGTVIAIVASQDEDISRYESKGRAPAAEAAAETTPAATKQPAQTATPTAPAEAAVEQAAPAQTPPAPHAPAAEPRPVHANGRLRASPVAKRLAEEAGIDLAEVEGTGPGGRIFKRNIVVARGAAPAVPPAGRVPT